MPHIRASIRSRVADARMRDLAQRCSSIGPDIGPASRYRENRFRAKLYARRSILLRPVSIREIAISSLFVQTIVKLSSQPRLNAAVEPFSPELRQDASLSTSLPARCKGTYPRAFQRYVVSVVHAYGLLQLRKHRKPGISRWIARSQDECREVNKIMHRSYLLIHVIAGRSLS